MTHEYDLRDPFKESKRAATEAVMTYATIIANPHDTTWDPETAMHVGIRYVGYMAELMKLVLHDTSSPLVHEPRIMRDKIKVLDTVLEYAHRGSYVPLRAMFANEEFMESIQRTQRQGNPIFQKLVPFIYSEGSSYEHIPAALNQPEIKADAARFLGPQQPQ